MFDEFAPQVLMPPESNFPLHLVNMDRHLPDGELAPQVLMPPEFNLPIHLVKMDRHLLDDELESHFMMVLTLDQGNSPRRTKMNSSDGLKLRTWTILLRSGAETSTISDRVARLLSHSRRFDRRPSKNIFSLPFWELFDRVIRKLRLPSLCRPTTAPRNVVPGMESQFSARFQIGGAKDQKEAVPSIYIDFYI
jgi:hypothetical protein